MRLNFAYSAYAFKNKVRETNLLSTAIHHPRKLWLRRALFQIHLWLGVLLTLYVIIISLSGSILVFQDEIRSASLHVPSRDISHIASINTVIANTHTSYPTSQLGFITMPQADTPWWTLFVTDAKGRASLVYADAATATPIHQRHLFIDTVLDLHVYLLMGRNGFILNCLCGIGLLVLAITGAVLWWPGIKLWTRGFYISLHHTWKRINYDTHNAIGIWTLFIVSWWGITAVYFLLPTQTAALVNKVSPLVGMKEPAPPQRTPSTSVAKLEDILATAKASSTGHLSSFSVPAKPGDDVTVYMERGATGDFSHRDILTFDGHTGKLLTLWHYGENKSLGDWFMWLMYPLHFGTLWGTTVKVIWSILGLALCALSITGLLMYWNRYLSKRWRALR